MLPSLPKLTLPSFSRRALIIASVAAAIVLLSAAGSVAYQRQSAAATTAASALRVAFHNEDVAWRHALEATNLADSVRAADSALVRADRALRDSLAHREFVLARARGQFAADARRHAADSGCSDVIVDAIQSTATADSVAATLAARVRIAETRAQSYKTASDSTAAALARLSQTASAVATAAHAVDHASRPSFLAHFRPRLGFGGAVGVTPTGRPAVLIGVTYGWTF